jgi:hypothetical protein
MIDPDYYISYYEAPNTIKINENRARLERLNSQ